MKNLGILLLLTVALISGCAYYNDRLTGKSNKVVLIGIDGATWDIILPMVENGELPNFASLMDKGAYGNLTSLYPIFSPRVWTSIATGKTPDKHGILGFMVDDEKRFYNSDMRKTKAIWNILSDNNHSVGIVAWLMEYPPERVNGFVITDRIINPHVKDAVYPGEISDEVRQIVDAQVKRLEKVTGETRTDEFLTILALHFREKYDPDFLAVYLRQIDTIGHEHWDGNVSIVKEHYKLVDGLIGNLTHVDKGATIVIVSDHGFGSSNPSLEGLNRTLSFHRINGIIVMSGPDIKRGEIENASVLDVTPTLLYLMGLPVGSDMDGKILVNAVKKKYLDSTPIKTIDSYDAGWSANATPVKSAADEELLGRLKGLGYVQ